MSIRPRLALVALVPSVALGSAAAASGTASPLAVAVSSHRAGARPVALALTLQTELRCGRLPGGSLKVRLPAGGRIPGRLPAGSVTLGGRHATTAVSGRWVVVGEPPPAGAVCDSIVEGPLRVVFTRGAGIGNPPKRGRYAILVAHGRETYSGTLAIS